MKKTVISILLAAVLICTLTVFAFADSGTIEISGDRIVIDNLALLPDGEAAIIHENDGMKLFIPLEYEELLLTEAPKNDRGGVLFSVAEKASVEAAGGEEGAGALFRIVQITEEQTHEIRCSDMSGNEIFAKDGDGNYYVFNHPTDVRFFRESNEKMTEDMPIWTELNEWAWNHVRDTFIAENEGLTAETCGNSDLEIFLARIAYQDDVNYTVSTTEFGPMEPGDVDPAPYLERLMNGVTYEVLRDAEAPDGEYVVLNFPEEGYRFDFFRMEGKENYIRQIWSDDFEMLYQANFEDGNVKASEIMSDWYDALVAAAKD